MAEAKYKSWFQTVIALHVLDRDFSINERIYNHILTHGFIPEDQEPRQAMDEEDPGPEAPGHFLTCPFSHDL